MAAKDHTIDYYNTNVNAFFDTTINADVSELRQKFLEYIPASGCILDFGCGSGRDTKAFLDSGYKVDAIDGSKELCEKASAYTGIDVENKYFEDLDEEEKYDGIWACSSILHLDKEHLKPVLKKMIKALKPEGVIYTSFKYGVFEGDRNGRFFTDFTEESFTGFIKDITELEIKETWITSDVRPGRGEEKWLNLILKNCKKN